MKSGTQQRGCTSGILMIGGMILSANATGWGACAAGHDPNAGYPFPDFMGAVLFLMGLTVIPLVVAMGLALLRRMFSTRFATTPLSTALGILMIAPLLSWAIGYRAQLPASRRLAKEREFHATANEAYRHYAAQITADPEIVLRERWFEWDDSDRVGAKAQARWEVFEKSFQPKELNVPYTADHLRRIYEQSPFSRAWVASHPLCPPDLIEQLWPSLFSLRDVSMIEGVIKNPATPRHLLEEYQATRQHSSPTHPYSHIIDGTVERRLERLQQDDSRARQDHHQ